MGQNALSTAEEVTWIAGVRIGSERSVPFFRPAPNAHGKQSAFSVRGFTSKLSHARLTTPSRKRGDLIGSSNKIADSLSAHVPVYPHAYAWRLSADAEPPCVSMRVDASIFRSDTRHR